MRDKFVLIVLWSNRLGRETGGRRQLMEHIPWPRMTCHVGGNLLTGVLTYNDKIWMYFTACTEHDTARPAVQTEDRERVGQRYTCFTHSYYVSISLKVLFRVQTWKLAIHLKCFIWLLESGASGMTVMEGLGLNSHTCSAAQILNRGIVHTGGINHKTLLNFPAIWKSLHSIPCQNVLQEDCSRGCCQHVTSL